MVTLEDVAEAVLNLDRRFDGMDRRFDGIDTSLLTMQRQAKGLEGRFNKFERRFIKHEAYTEGLDTILAKLESNTRVTATVVAEHGYDIAELKASLRS